MIPFWSHADRFHPQPSHRHLSQIMFHCCRPPKNPRIFQGREDFFLGDIRKPKWNCSSSKFTFPQDFLLLVIVLFSSGIRFTQHQNPLHPEFIFPGSYGDSDAFPFLGCVEDTPGGTRGVCKACKAMGASHICGIVRSLGQSLSQFCSRCFFHSNRFCRNLELPKTYLQSPKRLQQASTFEACCFLGCFLPKWTLQQLFDKWISWVIPAWISRTTRLPPRWSYHSPALPRDRLSCSAETRVINLKGRVFCDSPCDWRKKLWNLANTWDVRRIPHLRKRLH